MVLFYDDVKVTKPAGKHKYIRRAFKVVIGLGVLLCLSLWVLSALGGNSNALRLGIQDYLTDTSGYLAEMEKLNEMSFFPVSRISFQNLAFFKPVKKEEPTPKEEENAFPPQKTMSDFFSPGDMVASIGRIHVSMNFWDMFLGRRRFVELEVMGVDINAHVWLPETLKLESLKVVPGEESAIVGVGSYGKHKLETRMAVVPVNTTPGKVSYEIAPHTPINIKLGSLVLEGAIKSAGRKGETLDIKNLAIGKTIVTGSVTMKKNSKKTTLKADLKLGNSQLVADITMTPTETTGIITMATLDINDIASIQKAYDEILTVLGLGRADERVTFGQRNMTIDLVIQKLMRGESEWGMASADMVIKPYNLNISNISGLINGGALKGDFAIDATGKEATLNTKMHLRGWDYARLQTEVTGQADTHLTLTALGSTFDDLKKNLKGDIVTIAGEGELTGDSVLYWGSGLVNTMLPEISGNDRLKMNCMVADFEVKGHNAKARTLFMDLKDLTVVGTGSVNLRDMMLDLEFKPEPKEMSILDGGVAVNVTGPVTAPKIKPDRFSLGGKIGGLLLGAINPAFLAFSLTDLGLNDTHPCKSYIKQP